MSSSGISSLIVLLFILVIGVTLLIVIGLKHRSRSGLNIEKYRSSWKAIKGSLDSKNMVTYQMAILSADKLVDQAMRDLRVSGETMGERLKSSGNLFSNIDDVWFAHKLRNRIAHESDVSVNLLTARKALNIFEKALKDLGAI